MAELVTNSKRNVRVDMTPMVDLGFLLITFFVFTTTFTKPNMMQLFMPDKNVPNAHTFLKNSNTITFILGKRITASFGIKRRLRKVTSNEIKETFLSKDGIRKLIIEARKNALDANNFTVIIKPTDESNYKNTVDMLDEMAITASKLYAIADLVPNEMKVYEEIKDNFTN